jgi:DNA-binding GntR family transcriptional regulator
MTPAPQGVDRRTRNSRSAPARDAGSTPDRVAASIVRDILHRKLNPGERITEADLMARMEVGRSTVREALRILSASGAIELTRFRGAVIRTLNEADCRELIEVMEVLLGLAGRLAARNVEIGENRQRMLRVAEKLRGEHPDRKLASVLDERLDFYGVMFSIADNRELNRALPRARAQIFRSQFHAYLTTSDLRAMLTEYRDAAKAILAGDERRSEQLMRRHVERTGERMIPRLSRHRRAAG